MNITVEAGISPGYYGVINTTARDKSLISCMDSKPPLHVYYYHGFPHLTRNVSVTGAVLRRYGHCDKAPFSLCMA